MGREVGGGIGMGKTCEPKAFSFQCMTKFTTKKKKKKAKKKQNKKTYLHCSNRTGWHGFVCSDARASLISVAELCRGFPCGHRGHGFHPWIGKISWRRTWHPTPVFLLGESRGERSLVLYSPWSRRESDTAEAT